MMVIEELSWPKAVWLCPIVTGDCVEPPTGLTRVSRGFHLGISPPTFLVIMIQYGLILALIRRSPMVAKKTSQKKSAQNTEGPQVAPHAIYKPKKAVVIAKAAAAREHMRHGHAAGFMNFIREQGVIGLAVGLAIGTAAGDTVRKMVEGFVAPIVQFLVGSQERLETATWTLEAFNRTAEFKWGAFVSSFITLAATALIIYLIVHFAKLDRLDRKKS